MSARARFAALSIALSAAAFGCAPIPPPRVLAEADQISQSPSAKDMKEYAQPAWARAEKKRLEAHEALENGPMARAQFLAEEAIALYHEAVGVARLAKAALREKEATADREKLEAELAALDAEQARAAAEVDALEARLRAAKAIGPGASTGPEAEGARRDAARAFVVQAKLLCAAARVLGAGKTAAASAATTDEDATSAAVISRDLAAAEASIAALDARIGDVSKPAPADEASRARGECSSLLARTRRAQGTKVGLGAADALLEEISAMASRSTGPSMSPERDERGVIVTLRSAFDADALTGPAKERLAELDRVAKTHPRFPIAIVLHSDKPLAAGEKARWEARGKAIADALGSVEGPRKVVFVAGDDVPLVPRSSSERAANARVEIVFIAPEAL